MKNTENDLLIYGKEYKLYRDGKFIGVATFTDDENIGDSFIKVLENGTNHVFIADEWYFNN
jgi:hypothetical protein